MAGKYKLAPKIEIELRIKRGNKEVIVPLHIRDIAFEDKIKQATTVEIKAILFQEDWKLWGQALSLLPKI